MVKGYSIGDTRLVVWWNDTDGEVAHGWANAATDEGLRALDYLRGENVAIPTPTRLAGRTVNHAVRLGRILSPLNLESAVHTIPMTLLPAINAVYNLEETARFRGRVDSTGKPLPVI